MKLFKEIILVMLISGGSDSIVFGMERNLLAIEQDSFMPQITSIFGKLDEIDDEFQQMRDAALFGHLDKIRILMKDVPKEQRAAYIMTGNRHGYTVLQSAIIGNHGESVRALLEAVPEEHRVAVVMPELPDTGTILHYALLGFGLSNTEGIRILINTVPVEQRANFIMINDYFGHTVLDHLMISCHCIAREASVNAIKVLMTSIPEEQRIVVVISKNKNGKTPLHSAIMYCNCRYEDEGVISTMRALLHTIPVEHRAVAVMARDCEGKTVLDEAKKYRLEKITNMLAEFYPQQQASVQEAVKEERPSKKRNHDGEYGGSGAPAPKVSEQEQPKDSGWGCNVM